ncbi:MAG: EAL domain-containing protein [Candidatus Eremiobacteraeota bacterium]|nr:EAL domain-containing protein [Candidatus Eremiobacteraeota bacterium]
MTVGWIVAIGLGVALCATLAVAQVRRVLAETRRRAADAVARQLRVLDAVGDAIYIVDETLRISHVNAEAERLLGTDAEELLGRPLDGIVSPFASELVPDVRYARRTGTVVARTDAVGTPPRWVEVWVRPAAREVLVALRDVTERVRTEARLRENDQRLRLVAQNVDAVLWTTDREARFTTVAGGALDDLGLRGEALVDQPAGPLIAEHVLRDVAEGTSVRAETARGERWLRHHVEPLRDGVGAVVGAVGVSLDITELKRTQQQLFETAHRDALTGLPNRLALERRIEETIGQAQRDARRFALLFLDLDRFKTINDTLGHGVGDDVLREVAARLQEALRTGDVIARPGGDEFIVLVPRVGHDDEVAALAQRLVRTFAQAVAVRGHDLFVNVSVGAAIYPEHGVDTEGLVAHADAAMYRAKALGGNRFAFYDDAMEAAAADRLALETDLRHAIRREELRLLYQPVVELATRRVVGCEALLRWHHAERGVILPATFISIAEESGAIVALDRWVLRTACATAARLRAHQPEFRVGVNLSPRDLREPDLPDVVAALLAEHGLPAAALSVEVTEHVVLDDTVLPVLRRMCALGVQVAVDDFGVGYSSLAYLKRLPITALKIDRAFIGEVADDAYDQAIVGSIVSVAKTLGLHVTAEGLETDEQIAFVASLGCDEGQGFRFGAPVDAAALEETLFPGAARARALEHARKPA